MESGDLATWVGAVATFSAVAVALYQPARERKRQRMEAAKEQARDVSAWIKADFPPKFEGYPKRKQVYVQNASNTPVFRVVICLVPMDERGNALASGEQVSRDHELTGVSARLRGRSTRSVFSIARSHTWGCTGSGGTSRSSWSRRTTRRRCATPSHPQGPITSKGQSAPTGTSRFWRNPAETD